MHDILIIAAGSSSRLGQPKQLLPYRDSFLLGYIVEECLKSGLGKVHVVLGANKELIQAKLGNLDCSLIENDNWATGMGSSIACGVKAISKNQSEGIFVVLSDQPFFTSELLLEILAEKKQKQAPIILSKYKEGSGPPAYFDSSLFPELSQLQGDQGAKSIVKKYYDKVAFIDFEQGHLDVDTESDLDLLK